MPTVATPPRGDRDLPDQLCRESAGEAGHKHGGDCHRNEVNGPWMGAFAHKVEVPRVAFISKDVKVHSSTVHLHDKAPIAYTTFYAAARESIHRLAAWEAHRRGASRKLGTVTLLSLVQLPSYNHKEQMGSFCKISFGAHVCSIWVAVERSGYRPKSSPRVESSIRNLADARRRRLSAAHS